MENKAVTDNKPAKVRKGGILRSVLSKTPIRDGSNRERTWEARSDISEITLQGPRQVENTFKTQPDNDKRFQVAKVETVMYEILKEYLTDVEYDTTLGQRMSKMLAETIKTRVKEFKWTRYKLIVHVVIGENKEQDMRACSRFLWYEETDTFAQTRFINQSLFALAVCFAVYYE